jgi:hypothetical protein
VGAVPQGLSPDGLVMLPKEPSIADPSLGSAVNPLSQRPL